MPENKEPLKGPKDDRVGPDVRCPRCRMFIVGPTVSMGAREYCSSDCLLDDYEDERHEWRRGRDEQ